MGHLPLLDNTRIHPQGKVAPRMFLELARPKSDWIGLGSGGGVPVLISSIPKTIGFLLPIQFVP